MSMYRYTYNSQDINVRYDIFYNKILSAKDPKTFKKSVSSKCKRLK